MKSQVLLAGSDAYLRKLIAKAFERAGFQVTTAENAEVTAGCLDNQLPNILILDMHLDGSALDILRQARYADNKMNIILISGDHDLETTEAGALADHILLKPVMMGELTNLAIQLSSTRSTNERLKAI